MCDQTEVVYSPGDVVWVKLGPIWWPGQVHDYEKLPEEITSNLRKTPIAVVKFFQEDAYEYVKNLNAIYHYNCRRKHEFIKKGLDVIRSNNRDVPSNMKMFPNDIVTAEHLTHGNPEILDDEEFAPKEKEDYSELFGKKTPKKSKADSSKKDTSWRLKPLSDSSTKANRHSLPSSTVPRPITHRRFITKALEGRSDHEVRIRQQTSEKDLDSPSKLYNCHLCGFSSSRINVIVLHNKSHSAGYAEAYLHPQNLSAKPGRKSKNDRKITFSAEKRQRVYDVSKSDEPLAKKKIVRSFKEGLTCPIETVDRSTKLSESLAKSGPRKPVFGKKKSAKDKAEKIAREKQQNDAFRENLLKDWDDEDFADTEDKLDNSRENNTSSEKDSSMDSSLNQSDQKGGSISKPKETSCFDFDDSEDGLDIGETITKFGQKIPRILGGDKTRKQSSKNVLGQSPMKEGCRNEKLESITTSETNTNNGQQKLSSEQETEVAKNENAHDTSNEKYNEDLDTVFKSLLNETAVPTIPDAPTHSEIKKRTPNLEKTSVNSEIVSFSISEEGNDDGGGGEVEDGGGGGGESVEQISNENKILLDSQNKDDDDSNKDESFTNAEHFLVKTSEEVATSSSDDVQLECVSSPAENNVAPSSFENSHKLNSVKTHRLLVGENSVSEASMKEEVDDNNSIKSSNRSDQIISVDEESKVMDTQSNNLEEINQCKNNDLSAEIIMTTESSTVSSTPSNLLEVKPDESDFREMDFDINSMPVIIGDDMVEEHNDVTPMNESKPLLATQLSPVKTEIASSIGNKFITVKTVPKQMAIDSTISSGSLPIVVKEEVSYGTQSTMVGKESRLPTKKLILTPTGTVAATRPTQVATIKVQPSTAAAINKLTVPGGMITQKGLGTTSQVLILKSTAPSGKSSLQKISNASQVIQQGGKVLILTNPQGVSGQSKIIAQKNLSPSKITGTRIITTKGTVLTTGSSSVVTKANILTGSSKTVTTKSGQKILINKGNVISQTSKSVIINKSGLLTTVNSPTVIPGKSSLIAQNVSSKSENVTTAQLNLSQITAAGSSKGVTAANIITASGLTNNSMVLTPLAIGKNTPLTNSQKLKLITSKASPVATSSGGGTKLLVHGTQSRVILPSLQKNQQLKFVGNLKSQPNTGTILIQTSQGVIATTPLSSNQVVSKSKQSVKSSTPAILASKPSSMQVTQATLQPQNKFLVQKVKPGPNILQKTQKKPSLRNAKKPVSSGQLITSISPQQSLQTTVHTPATISQSTLSSQDTLLLPSAAGIPVIGQSSVVSGTQLDPSSQTALVYLTVDESGNYRPLETTPVVNYEGAAPDSQTLYIDPGSTDLDNIFLAIDEAGNVVNIARPVQNTFAAENSTPPPSQDILAKALADTQVLQQETIVADNSPLANTVNSSVLGGCMFVEQPAHYPQPSLSHSVLETSLTLNQPPIMTPLEVPSAVSPRSLDQISSLQTGFLNDSGLISANKEKKNDIHPSMPLLTEETDCITGNNKNETVFFTQVDGSPAVLTPVSSGSQLAFQLALDGNNVIVSSTAGLPSLGVISSSTLTQNTSSVTASESLTTASDNLESLININDTEILSGVKQDNSVMENFQSCNLSDHDNSPVTSEPTKNIINQELVYNTSAQESTPDTVTFVNEDDISSKNIGINCTDNEVKEAEDIDATSTENQSDSCTITDSDVMLTVGLRETTETKVADPYTGSENHHNVSVTNRPRLDDGKEETVVVSKGEHYSSSMMEISFSNGELSQRSITKARLSEESVETVLPDNIPSSDGSNCKRIKLDER